ncbi:MAG: hypothetical protein E7622_01845 [Ruminococcaceae bacterium]|nr:hypothetical protein [Oscillospiraceae bacterium]
MARISKYAALTAWLQEHGTDTVHFTFDDLNNIITLPNSAYVDRPAWANCTTIHVTSFQKGWLDAGYVVSAINLQERWVEFTKRGITVVTNKQTAAANRMQHRTVPKSFDEELLLTVPHNLVDLETDNFLMVCLNKHNSDIVEACIAVDPAYQSKGKAIMEQYFNAGDYSAKAYYDIINRIATENSTRTSKETMTLLAEYCADPANKFLERIAAGDEYLVDALLQHLVDNNSRRDKSLASKMCRYLNEWLYGGCAYTINDSVVRAIMPYYLAYYKIDKKLWFGKNFEELSYIEFYTIFSALRDKVGVLNNHELDHLIWYAYKNDNIRSEVAKALATVL